MGILENLTDAARSVLEGVEAAAGWRLEAEHLIQIDEEEFGYDHVAAAHYTGGPFSRMILGCQADLAAHVGRHAGAATGGAGGDREAAPAEAGFVRLCEAVHAAMLAALPDLDPERPLIIHRPDTFRVRSSRIRTFHLYVPTPAGDLELILELQPRQADPRTVIGTEDNLQNPLGPSPGRAGGAAGDVDLRAGDLVGYLRGVEADVLIKLADRRSQDPLHHAVNLRLPGWKPGDLLVLSSPCLIDDRYAFPAGAEIVAVCEWQGQILQFMSRVADLDSVQLDEGLHLPVLTIATPRSVEPGQRRAAFRIVPDRRLIGRIRCLGPHGADAGGPGTVDISILDLSATGARVALPDSTILSRYRWGNEAELEFHLPEPHGHVAVRAIIHRAMLFGEQKKRRRTHLGVEFRRDDEDLLPDLDKIRRYVLAQQQQAVAGQATPLLKSVL